MKHHCKFAAAVGAPFCPAAKGVKLPCGSPASTQAIDAILKLDGVLASDGSAVIMFNPSPYNDCASLWYTNSSSPLNALDNTAFPEQFMGGSSLSPTVWPIILS